MWKETEAQSAGQGRVAKPQVGRKRAVGIPMLLFVREAPRLGGFLARAKQICKIPWLRQ